MINKYRFNGTDAFTAYGIVFNDGTYGELLKNAKRKEGYSRNWPDENGTDRDLSAIYFESRILNLPITILAASEADLYTKYFNLRNFLYTSGYFNFDVIDMNRRFRLLYQDMTSFDKVTTYKNNNDIISEFTLQLIDDYPTSNTTIPG